MKSEPYSTSFQSVIGQIMWISTTVIIFLPFIIQEEISLFSEILFYITLKNFTFFI